MAIDLRQGMRDLREAADAVREQLRQSHVEETTALADALTSMVDQMSNRLDALERDRDARIAADAEAEAAAAQRWLDSLPSPDDADEPTHYAPGWASDLAVREGSSGRIAFHWL
jgi:hypothetical protein